MFIAIAPINNRRAAHNRGRGDPRQLVDGDTERGDQQHRTHVDVARVGCGLDAEPATFDAEYR